MSASRRVIGIDAGGTKTMGLLADEAGNVLTQVRAGGANLKVHGELAVEKVLYQVLDSLSPAGPAAALCLGMAGVDRAEEKELILGVLRRLGWRERVRVVNDAFVALVAGAAAGVGIVVVSGTGSIAYGADAGGQTARSGGWGYLLGDEGSAFWLGHAAVRAAIRGIDGRGPKTSLYESIAADLSIEQPSALVDWFYDQERSRSRVTELARLVERAAAEGDETAVGLLEQAAQHLASAAHAVARQLAFSGPFPVVLSGGVFRACPSLYDRLEAQLQLPEARLVRLTAEPATGAVELARRLLVS